MKHKYLVKWCNEDSYYIAERRWTHESGKATRMSAIMARRIARRLNKRSSLWFNDTYAIVKVVGC